MKNRLFLLSTFVVAWSTLVNAQYVNIRTNTDTYSVSQEQIQEMTIGPNCLSHGKINGHDYVLIGGKKWATMNVGATTVAGSYTTAFGDYFVWGETTPYYSSINLTSNETATLTWGYKNSSYSIENYKYCVNEIMVKYISPYQNLENCDDAAVANWGGTWHTPTMDDFYSLIEACAGKKYGVSWNTLSNTNKDTKGIYYLSQNQAILPEYSGVAGFLFVEDSTHKVFFPITGYINNSTFDSANSAGYWSSTLSDYGTTHRFAYLLYIGSMGNVYIPDNARWAGRTIRPVSD